MQIAIAGDAILNRRLSVCELDGFRELLDPIRDADISFTQFETVIHDYEGDEVYPAAQAGGTWQRAPAYVAEELDWAGFDIVSHASNHALDYSYGGLRSTWEALDDQGIAYVGSGVDLADARSPTYVESSNGLVGAVSMTSTFPSWSRAGETRPDVNGRPGVNPLRYVRVVDPGTFATVKELAEAFGWWVLEPDDGELVVHPPGLHNSTTRFLEAGKGTTGTGETTIPHGADLRGNLRAIEDAAARADLVVANLHTHEWDPTGDLSSPASFVPDVAHQCIDAGADVFVSQGSHSPLRGIEIYDGKPIFYDPGDFIRMSDAVSRFPADFYRQYEEELDSHPLAAAPSEVLRARKGDDPGARSGYSDAEHPPGGYHTGSMMANIIPVCTFDGDDLVAVDFHPGTWPGDPPANHMGIPTKATGELAERVVAQVATLSESYGTTITFKEGRGTVSLS